MRRRGSCRQSEGLFLAGIDPRREAPEVEGRVLDRLWDALRPFMREGVARFGPSTTLPLELRGAGDRNWVYRRRGQPASAAELRLRCSARAITSA